MHDPFATYRAAVEADKAWAEELRRVFGKDAGSARYDARGTSTPELRRLCEAKLAADVANGEGPARRDEPAQTVDGEKPATLPEPCPACKPAPGAVNHVPGCIFVGWGMGWQRCHVCDGTGRAP